MLKNKLHISLQLKHKFVLNSLFFWPRLVYPIYWTVYGSQCVNELFVFVSDFEEDEDSDGPMPRPQPPRHYVHDNNVQVHYNITTLTLIRKPPYNAISVHPYNAASNLYNAIYPEFSL